MRLLRIRITWLVWAAGAAILVGGCATEQVPGPPGASNPSTGSSTRIGADAQAAESSASMLARLVNKSKRGAALASTAPAQSAASILSVLPVGQIPVEIMTATPPPEIVRLARKLQAGVRAHPEMWSEPARPGGPPPYDPRIGLSKAEYQEFLASRGRLHPGARGMLIVTGDGPGRVILNGGKDFPQLSGVRIDRSTETVTTPYATVSHPISIMANPGQTASGQWDGLDWMSEPPARGVGWRVELAIGRLQKSGRGLFLYRLEREAGGKTTQDARLILEFTAGGRSHGVNAPDVKRQT